MKENGKPFELSKDKIRAIRRARGGRQFSEKYAGPHEVKKKASIERIIGEELDEEIENHLDLEICPETGYPHNYNDEFYPAICEDCGEVQMRPPDKDHLKEELDKDLTK